MATTKRQKKDPWGKQVAANQIVIDTMTLVLEGMAILTKRVEALEARMDKEFIKDNHE